MSHYKQNTKPNSSFNGLAEIIQAALPFLLLP